MIDENILDLLIKFESSFLIEMADFFNELRKINVSPYLLDTSPTHLKSCIDAVLKIRGVSNENS